MRMCAHLGDQSPEDLWGVGRILMGWGWEDIRIFAMNQTVLFCWKFFPEPEYAHQSLCTGAGKGQRLAGHGPWQWPGRRSGARAGILQEVVRKREKMLWGLFVCCPGFCPQRLFFSFVCQHFSEMGNNLNV